VALSLAAVQAVVRNRLTKSRWRERSSTDLSMTDLQQMATL
jgi:hypothetical protein